MKINPSKRCLTITCLLAFLGLLLAGEAPPAVVDAGGPLAVTQLGRSFIWRVGRGIPWTPDQGNLASGVSNAQGIAMLEAAFQVWANVSTARLRFRQDGQLSQDVRGSNALAFRDAVVNDCRAGVGCINPIVFDPDGSVIDALLGRGARNNTLGLTQPLLAFVEAGQYIQTWVVFNGLFRSRLQGVMVHEFGHFIGLDHTQVNLVAGLDFDPRNDHIVPTMFPFDHADAATLHLDDETAVSALYPSVEFIQIRGTISGRILLPDGVGFQGANVIARNVNDPELVAVSSVSGFLHTGTRTGPDLGLDDPEFLGFYEIRGLPPGRYTVGVEEIHPLFTAGSAVGPLDPPAVLPGPPEFFNGDRESDRDNPADRVEIEVTAGSRIEGIDIILNTSDLVASQGPVHRGAKKKEPVRKPGGAVSRP